MNTTECRASQIRHGPQRLDQGDIRWRVWAPRHESVRLVLFDRGNITEEHLMNSDGDGFFVSEPVTVFEGQRYGIQLGDGAVRPDPASRWQPDGIHLPSAVWDPDRASWNDEGWTGISRSDLVIYELHVGAFTAEGTFDAVIPRLPALRELGITALEVMPVAQFPGNRGWGYDGVHPFAVQNSYGGPHGLQRLVDACHQMGLAVILDVVYNHLGPEGNYLAEFGPYFTDCYQTPWGPAVNFDQPGCGGVRAFVLDNVRYWIREFHIDGLRLDAVQAIHDTSQYHILREIKAAADDEAMSRGWPVHVIAETDQNDVKLLDAAERGMELDAVWNDDFHHAVHALLTGERHGFYVDFGSAEHLVHALNHSYVYDGGYSRYRGHNHGTRADGHSGDRFVICIQNHDQVGNRVRGDRLGSLLSPAQQRLAAGLLLLAPHLPLIFMGEEYGETRPFPYFCAFLDSDLADAVRAGRRDEHTHLVPGEVEADPQSETAFTGARLSWSWPDESHSAGLRRLYRDLLGVRRHWPALRDFSNRRADLLPSRKSPHVLRFVRGTTSHQSTGALFSLFNLTRFEQPMVLPDHRDFVLLLSSEARRYRGQRHPLQLVESLLPYEFLVYGPASWKKP